MQKNHQSFFEVVNKSPETKTVDLLIYGSIPSWDEDTYKMKNSAETFLKEFKALEKDFDRINIHINSPGGSLYHAFPIFNAIRNSKQAIHTYNDGLAASAGGVLLMAGKTVHTAKNAILMLHNAMSWAGGNADELRETAKTLDTYDGVIADTYAERTGMSKEDVMAKYLNYKDHWLTAEEAQEAGFVHEIEEYESEDAPPSNIMNMGLSEVMNLYREKEVKSESLVDKILNKVRAAFPAPPTPPSPKPTNQTEDPMDFKNSLEILAKDQLTPEDIAAVKNDITAFTGESERFTTAEVQAKVDAAKNEIQAKLDEAKQAKTDAEAKVTDLEATVASYKKSGVTPDATAGDDADPIPGAKGEDDFTSETDLEAKKLRAEAGLK